MEEVGKESKKWIIPAAIGGALVIVIIILFIWYYIKGNKPTVYEGMTAT